MKRFVIFLVIGPFIGLMLLYALSSFSQETAKDADPRLMFMGAIFASYLFGLIPMLMVALLDRLLEGTDHRVALCAVAGCLGCWLLAHWIVPSNTPWQYMVAVAIAGAISAAACSWLSGEKHASVFRTHTAP
jgi:hypothetical protein